MEHYTYSFVRLCGFGENHFSPAAERSHLDRAYGINHGAAPLGPTTSTWLHVSHTLTWRCDIQRSSLSVSGEAQHHSWNPGYEIGTGWGGHLFRRFCKLFSESSTGRWAIHCSCHAAQASRGGGTFGKHITKPPEQVAAPPRRISPFKSSSLAKFEYGEK